MLEPRFDSLFDCKKPIIGMIHLSGKDSSEKVKRALEELAIYEKEGVDGAIIENYHGSTQDVYETLKQSSNNNRRIKRGINVLRNMEAAFEFAYQFGIEYIQIDTIIGPDLDLSSYKRLRKDYPEIIVLGGVRFKYTTPTGKDLIYDIEEGISKCDAIVTTGSGTGTETPLKKLKEFRNHMGNFPLIDGSGVNPTNANAHLQIADSAIVDTSLKKENNTKNMVDETNVREFMGIIKEIRTQNNNNHKRF